MEKIFEKKIKTRILELAGIQEPEPAMRYMVDEFDKKSKPVLHKGLSDIKEVIDLMIPFFEKFSAAVPEWEKVLSAALEIKKQTEFWGAHFTPELKRSPLKPPTSTTIKKETYKGIKAILMDFAPVFFSLYKFDEFLEGSNKLLFMSHDNSADAQNLSNTIEVMNQAKKYFASAYVPFKKNATIIFKEFDIDLDKTINTISDT